MRGRINCDGKTINGIIVHSNSKNFCEKNTSKDVEYLLTKDGKAVIMENSTRGVPDHELIGKYEQMGIKSTSMSQEYRRSIEFFEQILREKGTYFALAMLYDSGYGSEDLKNILKIMELDGMAKLPTKV